MSFVRLTRWFLVGAFVWLASGAGLLGFGDPRGFFQNEVITETPLYPGVTWYEVSGTHLGLAQVAHVVKVDISQPHLAMKALAGERFVSESTGQFFRRSRVSHLQTDNDSLVAINTAFFDIASTMAPRGLLMQDRMLLREPQGAGSAFIFTQGGLPAITGYGFSGTLRYGTSSRSFTGINREVLSGGQINVYQQPWDRSPGTSAAFTSGLQITEVLLEKTGFTPSTNPSLPARMQGRVLQVRENQGSVSIPANRFVITAAGSARAFLQQMALNSTVEVEWRLSGGISGVNWNTVEQGAAGGSLLVVAGQIQSQDNSHWNNRHPRSSIAISADETRLALVLIEGRQGGRAEGMSLHSLGQFLHYLGGHNALEFDGGGSSSIAARVNGIDRLLNTPSDGSERYVPAGLGVQLVPETPHTLFRNIRASADGSEAVISWETVVPTISYARFGQAELDRTTARDPIARTRHTALLTGLTNPGFYYARLVAELNGNIQTSQIVQLPPRDEGEVIIDDPEATFTGTPDWSTGAFRTPWGESYRHTATVSGSPSHTATYVPAIRISGLYDVYAWYTQGTNRPNDARYQIQHADGIRFVSVNQTTDGERWRLLASNLRFKVGGDSFVRLVNQSGDVEGRALIADAARWVLKAADPVDPEAVPAWWMAHFFGEDVLEPTVDADGDGSTIAGEYLWGTDPTDPGSRARYRLERAEGGSWGLVFSRFHEGRSYRVQGRGDLTEGSWQTLSASAPIRLPSGEGLFVLPNPEGLDRAFYRLVVEAGN